MRIWKLDSTMILRKFEKEMDVPFWMEKVFYKVRLQISNKTDVHNIFEDLTQHCWKSNKSKQKMFLLD